MQREETQEEQYKRECDCLLCRKVPEPGAADFGENTPWPLYEIMMRLTDAAEHLLRDHNCDAHGYEGVKYAAEAARAWLAANKKD